MTPSIPNQSSEYQRFEALTRRILTTPKAELVKHAVKRPKPAKRKRTAR